MVFKFQELFSIFFSFEIEAKQNFWVERDNFYFTNKAREGKAHKRVDQA